MHSSLISLEIWIISVYYIWELQIKENHYDFALPCVYATGS